MGLQFLECLVHFGPPYFSVLQTTDHSSGGVNWKPDQNEPYPV